MSELFQEDNDFHFPVPVVEEEEEETTDTELKQTLYVKPPKRPFTDKLFMFLYLICFIAMIAIGIILVAKKTANLSVAKSLFLPLWNSAGLLVSLVSASIFVSLIWLYLLSKFSNIILLMTGALLPIGIIGVSIASFIRFLQSTPHSAGEQTEFKVMASFCAAGILGGIYTGYMTLRSKRMIKTMNAIVNLATEVLRANSSLFVLSATLAVAHLAFSTFWLYLFAHIFLQGSIVGDKDTVITVDAYTTWLAIYFILIYFWTSSLLQNLEKSTVASVVGEWYFDRTDYINSTDMTWFHFEYVSSRSFGTIAFASLILGIVNTLKFLIKQTEKYGSQKFLRTRFVALLISFLTKIIDDLSAYTLVYVGLSGDPLLSAGYKCSKLFTRNLILGLLTSQMSKLMSFVGKLFVSSVIGLTVFWNYSSQTSQGTEWITVLVSTAIPYYVMGILTHVVETTIDATFICYLIDLDQNTCSHDKAHRIFAASLK